MSTQKVWLFDLDNTLHDAGPHIFPFISRAMGEYVAQKLGLDERAAHQLRDHYWRRYGATLTGMVRHHGVDPRHFLAETHNFPDLPRMVVHQPALRHVLKRLPGRKIIFSNAPQRYVETVLELIGIRQLDRQRLDDRASAFRTQTALGRIRSPAARRATESAPLHLRRGYCHQSARRQAPRYDHGACECHDASAHLR